MLSAPQVAAMMMVRNEADMVAETVLSLHDQGVTRLAVQDGNSTDGTFELLRDVAQQSGMELDVYREPDSERWQESKRELLYSRLRRNWPDAEWIVSVDADELYLSDLMEAIRIAHHEGADAILPFIPQFCLTVRDIREGALVEDPAAPYRDRRRWYAWGWRELHIWREHPDLHYLPDAERGIHRDPMMASQAGTRWLYDRRSQSCEMLGIPVQGHYPFRSVLQGAVKTSDRLSRGARYFGACAESWIVDEAFCGLHWWDGDPASFVRQENHHRLRDWYREARDRASSLPRF